MVNLEFFATSIYSVVLSLIILSHYFALFAFDFELFYEKASGAFWALPEGLDFLQFLQDSGCLLVGSSTMIP